MPSVQPSLNRSGFLSKGKVSSARIFTHRQEMRGTLLLEVVDLHPDFHGDFMGSSQSIVKFFGGAGSLSNRVQKKREFECLTTY